MKPYNKAQALFSGDRPQQLGRDSGCDEVELRTIQVATLVSVQVVLELPPAQQGTNLVTVENVPARTKQKAILTNLTNIIVFKSHCRLQDDSLHLTFLYRTRLDCFSLSVVFNLDSYLQTLRYGINYGLKTFYSTWTTKIRLKNVTT
jgi:hypothetical protein